MVGVLTNPPHRNEQLRGQAGGIGPSFAICGPPATKDRSASESSIIVGSGTEVDGVVLSRSASWFIAGLSGWQHAIVEDLRTARDRLDIFQAQLDDHCFFVRNGGTRVML